MVMETINIKGKDYVQVNERIKYFREKFQGWSLSSEIISLENGVCVIKATIKDENEIVKATGLAYEKEGSTFINKTSYIENCETSAWGRALGNLGIGIDTSIASAEEVQNAVLNQKPAATSSRKKEKEDRSAGFDGVTNQDVQIYVNLAKMKDIDEIKSYYEVNKENVVNREKFHEACNSQVKALKAIIEEFGEDALKDTGMTKVTEYGVMG